MSRDHATALQPGQQSETPSQQQQQQKSKDATICCLQETYLGDGQHIEAESERVKEDVSHKW